MFALLRHRDFSLLWFGGLISLIGNWTMITVLPFHMYDRTGSTLAAGSLWLMYYIPALLFGSFAGVFADRWDRKRTMVIVNLIQAALMLTLLFARSDASLWLIFVVVFAESTLGQFFGPAENALLPRLVGEENLVGANALNALNDNLARIAGPAIGGVLFAFGGIPAAVVLDSASFLLAAALIWQIRTPSEPLRTVDHAQPTQRNPLAQFVREWLAGLSVVRHSRLLLVTFIVMGVSLLGDSILTAMLVPFVDTVVQGGVQALGLVFSVRGIGGLVGSLVVPTMARWFAPRSMIGGGLIAVGVLLAIAINVADIRIVLACMLLVGVPVIAWLSTQHMLVQIGAPDELRGRVFGAYGTTNGVMLLIGTGSASALGDVVGIVALMNLAAGLYALAGGIALVAVPAEVGTREPQGKGIAEPAPVDPTP